MVLTSPFQCPKPPCGSFPRNPAFFWYNFLECWKHIGRHFACRACNIDSSPLGQQMPHLHALLLHLVLYINLLRLVPGEGNEEASSFLFGKDPVILCMRQPKISVQEIVFFVSATKEENDGCSGARFTLQSSFLHKSTKGCTPGSRSNKNERKWWWWGRKRTFMKPCWYKDTYDTRTRKKLSTKGIKDNIKVSKWIGLEEITDLCYNSSTFLRIKIS